MLLTCVHVSSVRIRCFSHQAAFAASVCRPTITFWPGSRYTALPLARHGGEGEGNHTLSPSQLFLVDWRFTFIGRHVDSSFRIELAGFVAPGQ